MNNSGELQAWFQPNAQPILLRWKNGLITELQETSKSPPKNVWLAPPVFDLQINGYAGIDFQQDHITLESLLTAAQGLHRDGCARWFLTLITDHWPRLLERFGHLKKLRDEHPVLARAIAGWHIEGPFLSAEPGYAGAHDPSAMRDPSPEDMEELRNIAESDPLLVTLAPERAGSVETIRKARDLGITVSLGHTNASPDQIQAAAKAGATAFTHLGNGCPRSLDRHDNIIWRVLDHPDLLVSFIVDRIHVSPSLLRLAHRALPPRRIYYTTDAMAAAGAPPGEYQLGKTTIEVGADQVVRQPGSPLFAGSALRPIDGIRRAAQMLQKDWREIWSGFSTNPSGLVGLPITMKPGDNATFHVIHTSPENDIQSMDTIVQGCARMAPN